MYINYVFKVHFVIFYLKSYSIILYFLFSNSAGEVDVILGAHKVFSEEPSQVLVEASYTIVHERWSSFTLNDDIGLIKLSTPLQFNGNAILITLITLNSLKTL